MFCIEIEFIFVDDLRKLGNLGHISLEQLETVTPRKCTNLCIGSYHDPSISIDLTTKRTGKFYFILVNIYFLSAKKCFFCNILHTTNKIIFTEETIEHIF